MEPGDPVTPKMSVAVGGAMYSLSTFPINEVVAWLTGIYVVFQLIVIAPRLYSTIKGWVGQLANWRKK